MTSATRNIEIDFDVHRRIEAERRSFDDPPNAVLRRLLGIDGNDDNPLEHSSPAQAPEALPPDPEASWTKKGLRLRAGTELKVKYSEVEVYGRVAQGRLAFDGGSYDAPSKAVMEVVRERRGNAVSINGWKHLYVREPGHGSWMALDQLRAIRQMDSTI